MRSRTRTVVATLCALGAVSPALGLSTPAYASGVPKCHGLVATIVGTSGNDHITGTSGSDVIVGLAGNDVIGGHGGADVLCGGPDSDRLFGGTGDDQLYGQGTDTATQQVDGGLGDDVMDVGRPLSSDNRFSFRSAPGGVRVDLRRHEARREGHDRLVFHYTHGVGGERVAVIGSPYDDVIRGTADRDTLLGGPGDDLLYGRGGADTLWGGYARRARAGDELSSDHFNGGAGPDAIVSDHGADDIVAGRGNDDLFVHGDFATTVQGGRGNDWISAHLPNDGAVFDGGPGHNQLTAFFGTPPHGRTYSTFTMDQASGTAVLIDSTGATEAQQLTGFGYYDLTGPVDWVFAGDAQSTSLLVSDGRSLTADLGAGDDYVTGTPFHDVLDGGDGNDRVIITTGADDCLHFETGTCS
jgi:Ca2+-binding RTX toxin-like protein